MNQNKIWESSDFEDWRQKTDPLADKVIATIIETDSIEGINKLFLQLRENEDISEIDFPTCVHEYFEKSSQLPRWVDYKKIAVGQKFFAAYGPQISLCLLCKSLPQAYACKKGAKVLYATGRMTEKDGSLKVFTRRLMETSQFIFNVCGPNGLDEHGKGIVSAQKVRLIHAAIRFYIKKYDWPKEYGEPINQQDMAGTLQSFSTLIIEGLEKFNIDMTDEEKEGYYHCWRVVGHLMGVDEQLNPPTYQEGYNLGLAIFNDQIAPSKEGEILTRAVCDFMTELLPGNIFKHTPEAIIKFLVGDKIATDLGLDTDLNLRSKIIPRLLGLAFHSTDEIKDHSKFFTKIATHINMYLLQSMLNYFDDSKKLRFDIPPSLKKDWNLN